MWTPSYSSDGVSHGTPIATFQAKWKNGTSSRRKCVSSWMKLIPRYSARTQTAPAIHAQPADVEVAAIQKLSQVTAAVTAKSVQ